MINNKLILTFIILGLLIQLYLFYTYKPIFDDTQKLKILLRQTARWATASKQDNNELVKVLHANYAMGYLMAIRDIYSEDQIETSLGKSVIEFSKEISNIQDEAHKYAINTCPEYGPERTFLSVLGGE